MDWCLINLFLIILGIYWFSPMNVKECDVSSEKKMSNFTIFWHFLRSVGQFSSKFRPKLRISFFVQNDKFRTLDRFSSKTNFFHPICWRIHEQQRISVVDPGTCISFLFTRCRPTRPRYAAAAAALGDLLIRILLLLLINEDLRYKFWHSTIVENVVTNLCAKFHYDRSWSEKVLGNWKSDNNNTKDKNYVRTHWGPRTRSLVK